jgi:hypothetical protein
MGYPRRGLDHDGSDEVNALVTTVRLTAVIAVTLTAVAGAHVAPSVDDNNRYLKLTPLGDRVRIAYTVFFGEVPGAIERRTIDTNRDGQISDAEGHTFGTRIAAEVAGGLEVELDGKIQALTWDSVDVGLGTPAVGAGSFSIDMVAFACLATARGHHHIVVRDRFRIPRPGETEAKVEDSPGVTIDKAHVGITDDPSHDFRFAGPGGPLSDEGLDLAFTAGPNAAVTPDATCGQRPAAGSSAVVYVIVAVGALVLVAGAFVWWRARARTTA